MEQNDLVIAKLKLDNLQLKKVLLETQSQLIQAQHVLVSKELTEAEQAVTQLSTSTANHEG